MKTTKLALFFAILSMLILFLFATYKFKQFEEIKLKEPEWKFYMLDNKSASRFVDLSYDSNNNPHIFFFAERTEEGLKEIYSNNTLEDHYMNDRTWRNLSLDNKRESGFFVSSIALNDSIKLCYMDYEVGDEKLYLATLKNNSFSKKVIDDKTKSGLSAGMYCSLAFLGNKSYAFYYVEDEKKFVIQDLNTGKTKVLDYKVGRDISAKPYNNKIYVAYRGRDDMHLRFGVYNVETGAFNFKEFPINVTSLDLTVFNGTPYIVFYNYNDKGIYFTNALDLNPKKIANGFMSTISMDSNNHSIYIAYSIERKGLFLAVTNDTKTFNTILIDNNPNAGEFLDLKVTEKDDIKIAYLDKTKLKYAEFERTPYTLMKERKELQTKIYKNIANVSFAGLLILILILIGHLKVKLNWNKLITSKHFYIDFKKKSV